MTDNEIIKALECCKGDIADCHNCPYDDICGNHDNKMIIDTLDLINRQKDEIEGLIVAQGTLQKYVAKLNKELERANAQLERAQKQRQPKCGACIYAKPTKVFGSDCYVECTNAEHLRRYCNRHDISKVRQKTQHACKSYAERAGADNAD